MNCFSTPTKNISPAKCAALLVTNAAPSSWSRNRARGPSNPCGNSRPPLKPYAEKLPKNHAADTIEPLDGGKIRLFASKFQPESVVFALKCRYALSFLREPEVNFGIFRLAAFP